MGSLTQQDIRGARAIWNEWVGDECRLGIEVVGDQQPARMDPDRPLGAVVTARLSLRLRIHRGAVLIFDQVCPYDAAALRLSVTALARRIAEE